LCAFSGGARFRGRTGRRYLPRGLGNLLYLVAYDCLRRGEPLLAALAVRSDTDEPGDGWFEDTSAQQTQCFKRWA
jgi:hypothetical protein